MAVGPASVKAEEAPLGVLLWPVRSPEFEDNFTLTRVEVVRSEHGPYVVWVYRNGGERTFDVGEDVVVHPSALIPASPATAKEQSP